ncbi:hypothetical protein ACFSTC_00500 [Nonomuraea ferruginea]
MALAAWRLAWRFAARTTIAQLVLTVLGAGGAGRRRLADEDRLRSAERPRRARGPDGADRSTWSPRAS